MLHLQRAVTVAALLAGGRQRQLGSVGFQTICMNATPAVGSNGGAHFYPLSWNQSHGGPLARSCTRQARQQNDDLQGRRRQLH